MVDPVAQARDFAGQHRQPSGHEIAERLPARVDVAAVAVDEIHRHVEHVVDIALEPETRLEDERQGPAAVGVGVGPHLAALAQQARRLALDKGRIGEQRHRHRLQRQADPELFDHVGFGLVVEIGLHRAGAQHHVEAEPALFRHVVAHDAVARLGHPRDVLAPPFRVEAEPDHAEPQFVADLAHLAQMLVHLVAGLVHGFERRAAQFELAAGFERDRTSRVVRQCDRVAVFDDRLPAEPHHARAAAPRCRPAPHRARGAGRSGGRRISRARCRCATPPAASIPDSRYSTSCRLSVIGSPGVLGVVVMRGGTPAIAVPNGRQLRLRGGAGGPGRPNGCDASRRRSPETPTKPRVPRCRRAAPWARARPG